MKASETIKERLNIVDLIGEYIKLDPAGSNFKGLCPFHQEKTPSFFVSPEKGLWHCFGCGEGGDVFTFIEKQENISFKEALKILAKKTGVALDSFESNYEDHLQERLLQINELAAKFYQKCLKVSREAEVVRNYLKERELDDTAQEKFLLGYAPNRWRALYDFLCKKGFKNTEIVQSGLVVQKGINKFYDRFRARLIFALRNAYGEVVGLAGRKLEAIENSLDKNPGKYINSPETALYHKSDFIYNLDEAKESIRQQGFVIITEGYTDVISSYLRGVLNITASSGTALTQGQLQMLKRYTNNLVLAYDADTAGSKATERGIELALARGFNLQIINLPEGQDPDDLARKDFQLWQKLIQERVPIMEFYFQLYLKEINLEDLESKKKAVYKILPLIKRMPDLIERGYWLRKLAYRLGLDEEVLEKMLGQLTVQATAEPANSAQNNLQNTLKSDAKTLALQEYILGFLISFPEKSKTLPSKYLQANPGIFTIYKILQAQYNKNEFDLKKILSIIKKRNSNLYHNIIKILFALEKDLADKSEAEVEANFLIFKKRLKKLYYWRKLKKIEFQIAQAEDSGKEKEAEEMSLEFQKLSRQYKKI